MEKFEFYSPTKIIMGKGAESRVGEETARYSKKVLLHYGGGSIKKSGLYDRIVDSLKNAGVEFVELGGVQPNPRLSLVKKGIELCRENGIDFILAVGGGSVIDSAKAISAGIYYDGDVWDFFCGKAVMTRNVPVGTVVTIPAAGSETSNSCVITNEDGWLKRSHNTELNRPVFAILNPELTFTLPPYQTACGIVDILAHVMERYFSPTQNTDFTDRLCEGAMLSIINNARIVMKEPDNYDVRAEIMLAASQAHNNWLGMGRIGDWGSHNIEHELSAMYDVAHGAGLAVVFPAWMKYVYKKKPERLLQFAVRVLGVDYDFEKPERTILEGIRRLTEFYHEIGMPTNLKELGVPDDKLEEMADKASRGGTFKLGNYVKLDRNDILSILELTR